MAGRWDRTATTGWRASRPEENRTRRHQHHDTPRVALEPDPTQRNFVLASLQLLRASLIFLSLQAAFLWVGSAAAEAPVAQPTRHRGRTRMEELQRISVSGTPR